MDKFEVAVEYVLQREGGLSENPNDLGGITNFGVSLRFLKSLPHEQLKKYGIFCVAEPTREDILMLSLEQAKDIYKGEFWDHAAFDKINVQDVCNFIFDMAVNQGINHAIKCAQRATWAVNKTRNLVDDGILGESSLEAINKCGTDLLFALRSERGGYYRLIVSNNTAQHENLEGWLNRAYGG